MAYSNRSNIPADIKLKAKSLYISGMSASEVASKIDVKVRTVRSWAEKHQWSTLRKRVKSRIDDKFIEVIASKQIKAAIDYVEPIVALLATKAYQALDEDEDLTSKDHLSHLVPLLKLKAQLTGEMEETTEYSRNEVFKKIMESDVEVTKHTIDPKWLRSPELIE